VETTGGWILVSRIIGQVGAGPHIEGLRIDQDFTQFVHYRNQDLVVLS
jgi:hypothetical protein